MKKVLEKFQKISESLTNDDESSPETQESEGAPKTPRKRRRRAEKKPPPAAPIVNLVCGKCGKTFGTRNNLFNHIKATGHSITK